MNSMCVAGILTITCILLLVAGCSFGPSSPDFPYDQIDAELTVDETTMTYTILIPDSYSAEEPAPLILALHYGGTVTPSYGKDFLSILVEPALGGLDAIMVAPNCPSQSGWTSSTSEKTVTALLDTMMSDYHIDTDRILVTGYSLGATGTWFYAAHYPEIFSAAIPVSGRPGTEIINQLGDIPLYVIHSRDDEVSSFEYVEEIVHDLQSQGKPVRFSIVNGVTHYDTAGFIGPLWGSIPWIQEVWGS